jgi:hypothetical protein
VPIDALIKNPVEFANLLVGVFTVVFDADNVTETSDIISNLM